MFLNETQLVRLFVPVLCKFSKRPFLLISVFWKTRQIHLNRCNRVKNTFAKCK